MTGEAPRVWALLSYRAGETSQILGLAEALRDLAGIPFAEKRIHHRLARALASAFRAKTVMGVNLVKSSPLEAPWPDLLVTAGAKNEPVARWIRDRSGGRTKLVFLGRTWCPPETFDLVVTTPQYRVPEHPAVLQNPLTITRVTTERLTEAREQWRDAIDQIPGPRLAVLVGGHSGSWRFGPHAARRLAEALRERLEVTGGTLMITTSSRTDHRAAELLESLVGPEARVHLWHRDSREENPYFGYLALADELIVTGDSVAMISEAMATGLPVKLFDLGTGHLAMRRHAPQGEGPTDQNFATRAYRMLLAFGPERLGRDLRLAHDRMLSTRQVKWLGDPDYPETCEHIDVRKDTVSRIIQLLAGDRK